MPMGSMALKIQRLKKTESCIRIMMLECIFSQIRGTLRNAVGEISLRSSCSVATLSAKFTVHPAHMGKIRENMRSAMWQRGRTDTKESEGLKASTCDRPRIIAKMLRWLIMAPFGWPVVPDV